MTALSGLFRHSRLPDYPKMKSVWRGMYPAWLAKRLWLFAFSLFMLCRLSVLQATTYMPPPTYPKTPKASFTSVELFSVTPVSKTLYVRDNPGTYLACLGSYQPAANLRKFTLNVQLNWNTDYIAAAATQQYTVGFTIDAYSTYINGSPLATYSPTFVITGDKPTSYISIDLTSQYININRFVAKVTSPGMTATNVTSPQVSPFVRADVYYSEEFEYDVTNPGLSMLTANPVTMLDNNLVKLSWSPTCYIPAPNYQVQLLRLFNTSLTTTVSETAITTDVDWSQALTIETGNSLGEITLTMAEGVGYYVWRVRPIGNAYDGGIANDRNWGNWTPTGSFTQGATGLSVSSASTPHLFYFSYGQYDPYTLATLGGYNAANDGTRNWIFTRSFVEGDATTQGQTNIGEAISYANGLQMATQKQARLVSAQKSLVSQTMYDYSGRAAMNTLPAPVNRKSLGYIPAYIKNASGTPYSAYDFDYSFSFGPLSGSNNDNNPSPMDSAYASSGLDAPSNYYSALNSQEENVPTAGGYPFSRTLFSTDGTSRPQETSMPGKTHTINNTTTKHTTRMMHSAVADMELIRVLGDEAPDEASVYKTITIDPNNSASVAYISKEGKTLATCLSGPANSNLSSLPSFAASPAFNVSYNINANNSADGTYAFRSYKTLGLAEQTNVVLNYSLTPNTYGDVNCQNLCATCDYKITLKITDNNGVMAPVTMTFVTGPAQPFTSNCTPAAITTNTTITLPAGAYTIERIIESNTSPATAGANTYINSFVQAAQLALYNNLTTGTGTIVDDAGVPVAGAPSVNMTTFFQNLTSGTLQNLYSQLGVTNSDTHKNIKIGCNTIRVPVWICDAHTCGSGDMDFEGYLMTQYKAHNPGTALTNQQILTAMLPAYSLGEFNIVVANMYTCGGYSCSALWNCWQGAVEFFIGQNNPNNPQSTPAYTAPGTGSAISLPPNYLDMFLNCAGYKIQGITATAWAGQSCSNFGYKSHPYAWFNYSTQCCACENGFVQTYSTCGVSVPTGSVSCNTSQMSNFIIWFNGITTNTVTQPCAGGAGSIVNKTAFYKCYLASTSASGGNMCDPPSSTYTTNLQGGVSQQAVQACKEYCEGRYNEFVTQLTRAYHNNNKQVQGDAWTLAADPVFGGYTFGTTPYTGSGDISQATLYCEVGLLVDGCKNMCSLTVQTNGQLGSSAELANMQNVFNGSFKIAVAGTNGTCPSGYTTTATAPANQAKAIALALNSQLTKLRQSAPAAGTWWNFYNFISTAFPSAASLFNNNQVFIHPDVPSYFEAVQTKTNCYHIWYYFNKNKVSYGTPAPKPVHTMQGVSPAATFVYTGSSTITVNGLLSSNSPSFLFEGSFTPNIANGGTPARIMGVAAALVDAQSNTSPVFNITGTSTLTAYAHSTETYGYWACDLITGPGVDVCGAGSACSAVCFSVTPASTVAPSGQPVFDLGPLSCEAKTQQDIRTAVYNQLANFMNACSDTLRTRYSRNCVKNLVDYYTANYNLRYYHYTLYYYDRAGNLVKTVPPAGVSTGNSDRLHHPAHSMITEYAYNSLGQLVRQKTPDGGETFFWYDAKGKLRFSQNAKQALAGKLSYTKYDALTRIVEVGEITTAVSTATSAANINNLNYPAAGVGTDITQTIYTTPASGVTYFGNKPQRYLQNRVSYSFTDRDGSTATTSDQVLTYYSYDPHGNVEWVIQDIPELGRNYIAYEYDLASGSVVKVRYNEAFPDRFFHRYTYDVDKRIKTVETSVDGQFWEADGNYSYYLHGPLKRELIGHDKIQGRDYIYTIHGWLKSLNNISGQTVDPGGDGGFTDNNMYVARDAYAMTLGYYKGDYASRNSTLNSNTSFGTFLSTGTDLYNGNISTWIQNYDKKAMSSAMSGAFLYNAQATGRTFKYDELNRITEAKFQLYNSATSIWSSSNDYLENFAYDPNGNITSLTRNGNSTTGLAMDNFTYNYYNQSGGIYTSNLSGQAPANATNRLAYVGDAVSSAYTTDIDNQTSTSNYTYDAIGNLTGDASENIGSITWNVYGKIATIQKTSAGNTINITYLYDASGNRVYKKVTTSASPVLGDVTSYYVRDAAGHSMAIYDRTNGGTSPNYTATYTLKEQAIYGSDRLGARYKSISRATAFTSSTPPAPQITPTLVHTSGYANMLVPQLNNTGQQIFTRRINSGSASTSAVALGGSEHVQNISSGTNTFGMGLGQAVAHDMSGGALLSAFAWYVMSGSTVVSTNTSIYVKDTLAVTIPAGFNNAPNAQALFMKKPGSDDQYYFFTIGTDGKPYYHTIDASGGVVLDYNTALDNTNTDYGQTMELYEDRAGQGNSVLYLRRLSGGNTYLKMFAINASGITPLSDINIGAAAGASQTCEIQVSSNGLLLAFASNTASNGEIYLYNLNADHQTLGTLAGKRVLTGSLVRSVEFSNTDNYIFYSCYSSGTTSMYRTTTASFASASATTMHTQSGTTSVGAIRKGANSFIYYLTNTTGANSSTINMFTAPETALTNVTAALSYASNLQLPAQPHLLDYTAQAISLTASNREYKTKEYELKDHLGNVHATVADFKVAFSSGTPDLVYDERFNDLGTGTAGGGTATGYTVVAGAPSTIVDNQNNSLRVYGTAPGSAVVRNISLGATTGGSYALSFDYLPGTCSMASWHVTNLGNTYGGLQINGRNDFVINVPSGTGSINLQFTYEDATAGHSFYIDNILIKKLDVAGSTLIANAGTDDFNTGTTGNWVGNNVTLSNPSGTKLKVTKATSPVGTWFAINKTVNLMANQLYRVSVDVATLTNMNGNTLYIGYDNSDGTPWLDWSQPVTSASTGTYIYYIIPKTNVGNLFFNIDNSSATNFDFELDNIKIDLIGGATQPLYTAVLNNVTDYYAFGAPMPGRNYTSTGYRYGFNGKELDKETAANEGGTQDYGMRIYNPSLGKFLSVDPLTASYPWYTPYQFAGNNPILSIDLDGAEENVQNAGPNNSSLPSIKKLDVNLIIDRMNKIDGHVNNIVKAANFDAEFLKKNEYRIKQMIYKKLAFDEEGNPVLLNPDMPGQNAEEGDNSYKELKDAAKAFKNTKEYRDFKKKVFKPIDKKIESTVLSKILGASGRALRKTLGYIFEPTEMGDQIQPLELERQKRQAEQTKIDKEINSKINSATIKEYGKTEKPTPLYEVYVAEPDASKVGN